MVNSSALLEFFALAFVAVESESQAESASRTADAAANAIHRSRPLHKLMAGSSFPRLPSVAPAPSYTKPGLDDSPTAPSGNCARHRENPAGWRRRVYRSTR